MLAHRKNLGWLCCCQYPVAHAHRQRYAALRAKTQTPGKRPKTQVIFLPAILIAHGFFDIIGFCLRKLALPT